VTPYGGTTLYKSLNDSPNKQKTDFSGKDAQFGLANCSDLTDKKLYDLKRLAYRKFYLQPNRIFRILRDCPNKKCIPSLPLTFFEEVLKG